MQLQKLKIQSSTILLSSLLITAVLIAYLSATFGALVAPMVVILVIGLVFVFALFKNFKIGVFAIFSFGIFMFFIDRLYPSPIPLGLVFDVMVGLTFIAVLVAPESQRVAWNRLMNPVMYFFIIMIAYQTLQVFNPNAVSISAWLISWRGNTTLLLFIICFHLLKSVDDIKLFTKCWIALAAVVALYGIYQEIFGLSNFEWRWIYATPFRYKIYFIWGHMRKFSFLSDPASFGIFMAFSGLSCLILSLGPFKTYSKVLLGAMSLLMFISMSFSGTRTAYVMVISGVVFYILLTIRSRKTMIAAIAAVLFAGVLLFGPFYGGTINRIRSAFNPEEDASMGVRDRTRNRVQPYILQHPIGGGLNTTGVNGMRYSPGHQLAGDWDTDSGYLTTALEMGWMGLLLFMSFSFYICLKGIKNFYSLKLRENRVITLAYVIPFFTLTIAQFTQDAMFQKSVVLIVMMTYALMERMPMIESENSNSS